MDIVINKTIIMMMNKKSILLLTLLVFSLHTAVQAQAGRLINKLKNKTDEIKGSKASNAGTGTSNSGSPADAGEVTSINDTKRAETEFELAEDKGYTSGTAKYNYDMLTRYYKPLRPYTHIRKVGEQGNLHFAKDYPELKDITEPAMKNVTLSFSPEPYKGGSGKETTQFTSANNHIYARITTANGTIKDAFGLGDDNYKISVDYHVYPSGGNSFNTWAGHVTLYVDAARMNKSTLDFDIKPSPSAITVYNDPGDKYAFYISAFSSLHYDEFFPKSGAYKIGIKISVPVKDEWGKNTGKQMEAMNFFDYQFDVKDAKAIMEEGQVVRKAIQTGIKFAPKPMPKEWKLSSSAPVVSGYTAAKYNALYSNYYKDVKIIKTYLSPAAGAAWKVIMSNDNIMPAYKYCTQTVFFFVKDAAGNCYYHPCDLRQDYTGGGTYGPIHLAVFDEEKVYVSCSEMK
jgi:hypothetical protein